MNQIEESFERDGKTRYVCPICKAGKVTDDRMGHHLVTTHWDEIVVAFGGNDQ